MDNKLELYHNILFLTLRPGRHRKTPQSKYKELFSDIKRESYHHQPTFEVEFFKPRTEKAKYYQQLINNESIRYYNFICDLVNDAIDNDIKKMWVHTTLAKVLTDKLIQVASVIERLDYPISNIDPKRDNKLKDATISEETFIYQYLKIQLIQLYLNIQEAFGEYLNDDKLEEEDIYLKFFNDLAPSPSFIKECEKFEISIPIKNAKKEILFHPISQDISPILKSKANFNIVYSPRLFGEVECKLYEYEIIDIDYQFIKNKKQSNSTLLAAVYKILIENNYFRRKILGTNQAYSDLDIRKYLDERYSTDTAQQFRRIKTEEIEEAKMKLPWLEKITKIS